MCQQRLLAFLAAAALAACSTGAGMTPATPGVRASDGRPPTAGRLTLRIRVPKKQRGRRPAYVSPATQAMTIAIAGPTHVRDTIALAAGTNTLTVPALIPCRTTANCYTATIATYDAIQGCPSACAIPPTAHELSGNQNVAFTIASGRANVLGFTLDGIVASVIIVPLGAPLGGSSSLGFTLSKCFGSSAKVQVLAADADGNFILGAGAPTPSLFSNDTKHLAVAPPNRFAPNTFTLSRPAIPNANHVVQLTAAATPLPGVGGFAVILQTNVTFNSDVCGVVTEFSPNFGTHESFVGIVPGPDGNLWFTDCSSNLIGRITTAGVATSFSTGLTAAAAPRGIAIGPDGNLWFAEFIGNRIGRITPSGTITEFSTGITAAASPYNIASGADKNLWFTEINASTIGRITTGGVVTEFASGITAGSYPIGISAGPDGNLWFTEMTANRIGRITTTGTIAEFPTGIGSAVPQGITLGPDRNLWYADSAGAIGQVTIAGAIREYSLGADASGSYPNSITVGPDGNLWFTETYGNRIGRITPGGAISEFSGLTATSYPNGIATGPDGSIWFTEQNKIGRLQ